MATRMSGRQVAACHRQRIVAETRAYVERTGRRPCLAVVLVGNDPASISYVTSKRKACEEMGFEHRDYELDGATSEADLLALISRLNVDDDVDGILVQFPTPAQIDDDKVVLAIDPAKDVDGLHPVNAGLVLMGREGFVSCTPKGILALLDYYGIATDGRRVCIIGRSNLVGKPLAALLMQKGRDATVTVCNTHTHAYTQSGSDNPRKRHHHRRRRACRHSWCRHGQ